MTKPINDKWEGCYDNGWQGLIVPESFSHPAKMAYGLLEHILNHAILQGFLNEGDCIVDPFGGIGSTGIMGAYKGFQVISVELESRFSIMAAKNYLLHCQKGWCTCGDNGKTYLQLLQKTISETTESSKCEQKSGDKEPVLFDSMPGQLGQGQEIEQGTQGKSERPNTLEQGQALVAQSESQIIEGSKQRQSCEREKRELEGGEVHQDGRICGDKSKRQTEAGTRSSHGTVSWQENDTRRSSSSSKRQSARQSTRKPSSDDNRRASCLSQQGRQKPPTKEKTCPSCGKFIVPFPVIMQGDSRKLCSILSECDCVVSSPPFMEAQTGGGIAKNGYHNEAMRRGVFDLVGKRSYMPDNQGKTKGNLSTMKPGLADAVISSPPYAESGGTPSLGSVNKDDWGSEGQLGQEQGETFWSAAKEIVEQCYQILKDGGVAIWVAKDFVRKGKRVDFCGDWRRLCESVGFKTLHEHHAMLVKETEVQTLFGHTEIEKKERKSFFRRLAEAKGSPRIDYEVVLCMRK